MYTRRQNNTIYSIPREQNAEADKLAKEALDSLKKD